MTISYKWLSEYLPVTVDPERLSRILTSIGLEVESMEKYETIKGSLEGLLIGEVITCEKHPDADEPGDVQGTGEARLKVLEPTPALIV